MSVRSRYTGRGQQPSRPAHTPQPKPAQKPGVLARVKKAIKSFDEYRDRNQKNYVRQTGDSGTLGDDLREIPIRVIREMGKLGREESAAINSRCRRDSDEEIYRCGIPQKPRHVEHAPKQHLEFVVKPAVKKKPKPKIIKMYPDPDAEVE